ncbi:hypothetical protein HYPSUDRAFT_209562 [Hypholoma sublateritium FD-334 SS-4]|uniref:Uncharacterized protein n=1 Tax=Hypholoma sublateritium (strain FD-334 SS-4) TaxID=945553 RepID=A0A0D2LRG4_HYPSF|nr:hypothetical protein HYPSUDRAFT_209562 [Hypholoma sublateritium FD-334 SS-4]
MEAIPTLINKALLLEKPVSFDFLVKGELLHTALNQWCVDNGVGEEETLEIEYIESNVPPQKRYDFPHESWMAAKYAHSNLVSTTMAHTAPITSLRVVSSDESTHAVAILASLHLHKSTVSSIASNNTGTNPLTSSWDGLIELWNTNIPAADENSTSTRRKVSLLVFKSYIGRMSKAMFVRGRQGLELRLRLDVVRPFHPAHTSSAAEKPFLDLALAVPTDRTMTIRPARVPDTPCLTGAYDGAVRVWDMRRTKGAVATFRVWKGKQKVLGVDWWRGIVGVGGEGGLEVWKVPDCDSD